MEVPHLRDVPGVFTITDVMDITNRTRDAVKNRLRRLADKGLVESTRALLVDRVGRKIVYPVYFIPGNKSPTEKEIEKLVAS